MSNNTQVIAMVDGFCTKINTLVNHTKVIRDLADGYEFTIEQRGEISEHYNNAIQRLDKAQLTFANVTQSAILAQRERSGEGE